MRACPELHLSPIPKPDRIPNHNYLSDIFRAAPENNFNAKELILRTPISAILRYMGYLPTVNISLSQGETGGRSVYLLIQSL